MSYPNRRNASRLTALLLACLGPLSLRAETIALNPVADTTLIEIASEANLGGAGFFNAGTAGNGFRNRSKKAKNTSLASTSVVRTRT
jgi:hypothetical protein